MPNVVTARNIVLYNALQAQICVLGKFQKGCSHVTLQMLAIGRWEPGVSARHCVAMGIGFDWCIAPADTKSIAQAAPGHLTKRAVTVQSSVGKLVLGQVVPLPVDL
jgi:hypothetical protein